MVIQNFFGGSIFKNLFKCYIFGLFLKKKHAYKMEVYFYPGHHKLHDRK